MTWLKELLNCRGYVRVRARGTTLIGQTVRYIECPFSTLIASMLAKVYLFAYLLCSVIRLECQRSENTMGLNSKDKFVVNNIVNVQPLNYSVPFSSIRLPPSIFQKSVVNFGQINANVRNKLATNQCLDFIVFGTSVTCAEALTESPERPQKFEDGWPFQLLELMRETWSPCFRGATPSNHSFVQVRCYGHKFENSIVTYTERIYEQYGSQEAWLESVQIERRQPSSKLLNADIIFVEPLDDMYPSSTKTTEAFVYSLLTLPSKPSLIYVGASLSILHRSNHIWSDLDIESFGRGARRDSMPFALPVMRRYGVPFISAVDAFGPFISEESQDWMRTKYICDNECHLSRTGMKILATLLSHYLFDLRESLVHTNYLKFPSEAADSYVEIDKIEPLLWKPEQLKALVTEAHPPLTITLNGQIEFLFMWLTLAGLRSSSWLLDHRGLPVAHSLFCTEISAQLVILVPYKSAHVHFFHQKMKIVLGKNVAEMGTVHIEVRIFGQAEVLGELTVDCLLPSPDSAKAKPGEEAKDRSAGGIKLLGDRSAKDQVRVLGVNGTVQSGAGAPKHGVQVKDGELTPEELNLRETLVWYDENIRIAKRFAPTDSLEITFTVIESNPPRDVNTIRLASIHLS